MADSTVKPHSVVPLDAGQEAEWRAFLETSGNGTLFHDLRFLAYHPPDRFRFHHLAVRQGGSVRAFLPGGLADVEGRTVFRSPLGASIGGFVLKARPRLEDTVRVIEAVQRYAVAQGWSAVEITLPPSAYHPALGDKLAFALYTCGFATRRHRLCYVVDLTGVPADMPAAKRLFEPRQSASLTAAHRNGVVALEGGSEHFRDFASVFEETYARHGVAATHTLPEIEDLLRRFPDRVRVWLAVHGQAVLAGLLVLRLTAKVATTFYICSSTEHRQSGGNLVALAALIDRLVADGFRCLDLGPSTSGRVINSGVAFFKEGLGAVGHSRTTWVWAVS